MAPIVKKQIENVEKHLMELFVKVAKTTDHKDNGLPQNWKVRLRFTLYQIASALQTSDNFILIINLYHHVLLFEKQIVEAPERPLATRPEEAGPMIVYYIHYLSCTLFSNMRF